MANCQYCGMFTQSHCVSCLVFACTEHLATHYMSQTHRAKAVSKHFTLDENGAPIVEQRQQE